MSTLPARSHILDPLYLLRRSWAISPALTLFGIAMLITTILTLVGIFVDSRIVTGSPVWVKPAKFAISTAIYAFTLVWLVRFVQGHPRLVRIVTSVTTFTFVAEMVIIIFQAARGTTSHFNVSTQFDAALYAIMAISIVILWFVTLLAAVLMQLQRFTDSTLAWALRLGLFIALIGMALAFLMTARPTAAQQAMIAAGHVPPSIGAHSVGVVDGGPGIPFLGWSTIGGDLRIPHFFGLHGLQVLIIIGLLLLQIGKRWGLDQFHQVAFVWTTATGYLGFVALLTWQALRGQSIIAPDSLTLQAYAVLIGCVALASIAILTHARMQRTALA
ncbi:MAG: hypothetical protein PVS3B1_25200 [Ktedonobacteraceae bacterium]